MRQLCHRIDRDLTLLGVSLAVAVRIREVDLLNVQRGERLLRVPLRQAWRNEFIADRL
jgi:hypothetical protein